MAKVGRELVAERSISGWVNNSLKVYFSWFLPLAVSYALPLLPFTVLKEFAAYGTPVGRWTVFFVSLAATAVVELALLLQIRDVVDGGKAARFFPFQGITPDHYLRMIVTRALEYVILFGPFLILNPGGLLTQGPVDSVLDDLSAGLQSGVLVAAIWMVVGNFLLVLLGPVVAFEKEWGIAALRRAVRLARNYYTHLILSFIGLSIVVGIFARALAAGTVVATERRHCEHPAKYVRERDLSGDAGLVVSGIQWCDGGKTLVHECC